MVHFLEIETCKFPEILQKHPHKRGHWLEGFWHSTKRWDSSYSHTCCGVNLLTNSVSWYPFTFQTCQATHHVVSLQILWNLKGLIDISGSFVEKKGGHQNFAATRHTCAPSMQTWTWRASWRWFDGSKMAGKEPTWCTKWALLYSYKKKWGYNTTYRGCKHSHPFIRGHL